MRYEFDDSGFVRITVDPAPNPEEEVVLYRKMIAEPAFQPGIGILLDNRARQGEANPAHLKKMARFASQSEPHLKGCRCAIVVSNDIEFGMARMYELMTGGEPLEVRVFRDIGEAEAWLRKAS